jgi:hypothetical protein
MLDVAIGFLTQPLPKGRNVAIITPGGSYGVLCAEACEQGGLNVVPLPQSAIEDLNKIFPPRWSHANPVDPAGDRNFVAYLTAPARLLELETVDSLIFMGFGGFTLFGNLMLQQRTQVEEKMHEDVSADRDAAMKAIVPIIEDVKSENIYRAETAISQLVGMMGMLLGIQDKAQMDDMAAMTITARHSGKLDDSIVDNLLALTKGDGYIASLGKTRMAIINDMITGLMRALVGQWMLSYGKPVITTTFTEEQVKLAGDHYDYTSGDRAARVLLKLTEYYDYLNKH